jgi:hypothetical protein
MEELVGNTNSSNETSSKNAELVERMQQLIAKINNLVQHIDEPEYLVDLVPDEVVQQYGREQIEKAARAVLRDGVSETLSKKFSALLHTLAERHFGSLAELFLFYKVEARYSIDPHASTGICMRPAGDERIIELPVSSEAVMVERLVDKLLLHSVGRSSFDAYMYESNRLYDEDAPMTVHPERRWLSADEFITTYKQRPRELE